MFLLFIPNYQKCLIANWYPINKLTSSYKNTEHLKNYNTSYVEEWIYTEKQIAGYVCLLHIKYIFVLPHRTFLSYIFVLPHNCLL